MGSGMDTKRAATRIAKVLFRFGKINKAQRLVLEMPDGGNGGGWCFSAVVGEIDQGLQEEVMRVAPKGKPKPPVKKPAKKKRTVGMLSPVLHPWK